MRTYLLSLFTIACLLTLGAAPALASQASTPTSASASAFADLGLPELNVTITSSSFEGIPESLAAGRYLVTANAGEGVEPGQAVNFVQPVGVSVDEFLAAASGPPPAEASPEAGMGTPSADGSGAEMLPGFVYTAIFAGGATEPGSVAVIDLAPGSWFAWGGDPSAAQQPVTFEVTGDMPADLPTPDSTATISLGEYVIKVTEGELKVGPQIVEIDNIGAQPHYIELSKAPDGMTVDQVTTALEGEMQAQMSGTPVPETDSAMPEPETVAFIPTQSTGTTTWTTLDLESGVYIATCFFPDEGDGMPHALHGMYTVLTVAG